MKDNNIIDVTGISLNPNDQGKDCPGNGENQEIECCCDECDFLGICFPQFNNK